MKNIILVDISKSQKKLDKIKINANNITAIYPIKKAPATTIMDLYKNTPMLIKCSGENKSNILIATMQEGKYIYYTSALTAEELARRITKAEADTESVYIKRKEKIKE